MFFIKKKKKNYRRIGSRDKEPTLLARNENYTETISRPLNLPKAAMAGCRCLKPAWNQARISSPTQVKTLSIVHTRRSKVLSFLSFHSSQQVRTTSESKHRLFSFRILFLAAIHHIARLFTWGSGVTASQSNLRNNLNHISRENEQQISR